MTVTIWIADQETRVRHGLRIFLEQQAGWKVLGEAADAHELLRLADGGCPDLVLLDWELPGMPVEVLLARLGRACPHACSLVMSGRVELRQAALQAGARGFASKTEPPERLLALVKTWFSPERSGTVCQD